MSSAVREPSQIPNNKLYINIAGIQSTIYSEPSTTQAALAVPQWATLLGSGGNSTIIGQLSTAGSAVLRDMGKTIYFGTGNSGASQSTILRKVQLVATPGTGTSGGDVNGYLTGYISLGGQTYGGGDNNSVLNTKVARLN